MPHHSFQQKGITLRRGEALAGLGQGVAFLVGALMLSCEEGDNYPLEATFCDDWCRATDQRTCNRSPHDCVSDCESTLSGEACFGLQKQLLSCYESAADEDFVCTGEFSGRVRVTPETCQPERDALFNCVNPGIGSCLTVCRGAQMLQRAQSAATRPTPMRSSAEVQEEGEAPSCPALDASCEELCWSIYSFNSDTFKSLGVETASSDESASNEACMLMALQSCLPNAVPSDFTGDGGTPPPSRSDTGQPTNADSGDAPCGEWSLPQIGRRF